MDQKSQKNLKSWIRFYTQAFNIQYHYGQKIFDLIFDFSTKSPENISFILLYRKIIELSHGQISLLKNNQFLLMKSFNREAFETALFIKYISTGNKKDRALSYQIEGLRDKIRYYESLLPSSKEFVVYNEALKFAGISELTNSDENIQEVKSEIERLSSIYEKEPLKSVIEKYKLKNLKIKWYSVDILGVNTIRNLAEQLNYGLFYHNLYKNYSGYIHGYNLNKADIITISQAKNLQIYEVPAPPLNLAEDFYFSQKNETRNVGGSEICNICK